MSIDNVQDLTPRVQYVATASQTVFPYTFPIFDDADLIVQIDDVTKTITTDYTVSGAGDDAGGDVTLTSGATVGQVVTIYRDTEISRLTDVQQNGPIRSTTFNDEMDNIYLILQENKERTRRALRVSESDTADLDDLVLPAADDRANKYLAFDENGEPVVSAGTGSGSGWIEDIATGNTAAPITVATVAAMKALTGLADGATVQPQEFYSGDGFKPKTRVFVVYASPPAENGGTVIHDTAGAGYFRLDAASSDIDIREFGAKVDDSADDSAEIQACLDAAATEGFNPTHLSGIARINTKLTVPDGVVFRIDGDIRKNANIDMIELSNAAKLVGAGALLGSGATYTGRGVVIAENGDQDTDGVSIIDMDGYCVEYASGVGDVGFRSTIRGGTIYRRTRTDPAIKYPDSETNGDRKVISVDAEGGRLCDFAGCATVLVQNCNVLNFQFGASSKKVSLIGNRIATTGLDLDVLGMNHCIVGNIVAGVIDLNSGANNSTVGLNWDAGVVDNSGSSTNRVFGEEVNITPVWNASGTAPAVGNGSIFGRLVRNGKQMTIFFTLTMGSTTTFGTGTYTFTLPSPYSSLTVKQAVGVARALDSGTNFRTGVVITSAGVPTFSIYSDAGSGQWGATVPFTWAQNDTILAQITCEVG